MFAMNPPPTVGLKTLIIFGLSFVKQLAHGLVKRFAGYVTLLNAFVLDLLFSILKFYSRDGLKKDSLNLTKIKYLFKLSLN